MQEALVAAADDLVGEGVDKSGIPLTPVLRHYLAITLARFMRENVQLDRLTVRVVQAMDRRAPPGEFRTLADTCLVACALFERRLRRAGGSLRHYSGLGQAAYGAAALTEQAASFPHMRDVLAAAAHARPSGSRALIDAARGGSITARAELARSGILTFPSKRGFLG